MWVGEWPANFWKQDYFFFWPQFYQCHHLEQKNSTFPDVCYFPELLNYYWLQNMILPWYFWMVKLVAYCCFLMLLMFSLFFSFYLRFSLPIPFSATENVFWQDLQKWSRGSVSFKLLKLFQLFNSSSLILSSLSNPSWNLHLYFTDIFYLNFEL